MDWSKDIPALCERHLAALRASGIEDSTILDRGYRTVDKTSELEPLGFTQNQRRVPGLLIPLHAPNEESAGYQFRPDTPRLDKKKQKPIKYETPFGQANRLDTPPSVVTLLRDRAVPLFITEGSKKADAAACRGLACISLAGVYCFVGRTEAGRSEVIKDFDLVPLEGRKTYIVFDSDAVSNPKVGAAEERLSQVLRSKGATAKVLRIPPGPNGAKQGLDDYLAAGGTFENLLATVCDPLRQEDRRAPSVPEIAKADGVELWSDKDGTGYATFDHGRQHAPVQSSTFRAYLRKLYYKSCRQGISDVALSPAVCTLEAEAIYDGPVFPVELRVGWSNGCGYTALHDKAGRVIELSKDGWKIIDGSTSPVRFVKRPGLRPLCEPERGGSISDLKQFVNCEPESWPLVLAFLVGSYLPIGTFPILVATGEQASGKSKGCEFLAALMDPFDPQLLGKPKDQADLASKLSNHFLLAFDNLSGLSPDLSDSLCSIVGGQGFSQRALYTDTDERIIRTRKPIILNGISDFVSRPDLMDRSLFLRFKPFEGNRVTEEDLYKTYAQLKPKLFGALLDRVVRALNRNPEVQPLQETRLADFSRWALAACSSDREEQDLREAIVNNREDMNSSSLEADLFAQVIIDLVKDREELTATIGELLGLASERKPFGAVPDWPKTARAAKHRLDRVAPILRNKGVAVIRLARSNKGTLYQLLNLRAQPSQSSRPSLSRSVEPKIDPFASDDGELLDAQTSLAPSLSDDQIKDGPGTVTQPSLTTQAVLNLKCAPCDGIDGRDDNFPAKDLDELETIA